jgi:hypothetical protein
MASKFIDFFAKLILSNVDEGELKKHVDSLEKLTKLKKRIINDLETMENSVIPGSEKFSPKGLKLKDILNDADSKNIRDAAKHYFETLENAS